MKADKRYRVLIVLILGTMLCGAFARAAGGGGISIRNVDEETYSRVITALSKQTRAMTAVECSYRGIAYANYGYYYAQLKMEDQRIDKEIYHKSLCRKILREVTLPDGTRLKQWLGIQDFEVDLIGTQVREKQ